MTSGKPGRGRMTLQAAIGIETMARLRLAADEEFTTPGVLAGQKLDEMFSGDPVASAGDNPEAAGKSRLAEAREREKLIDIEMKELKLAKERKETLSVDQVLAFYEREVTVIRSRLLSIPQQVLGLTPAQTDDLEKAIADAMTDLTGNTREAWDNVEAE